MVEFILDSNKLQDGVYILSPINDEFESLYLKVREKEKRIYSDEEVRKLPFASYKNLHRKEWELRAKSFNRFKEYLATKNEGLNILDLGCGNGWLSGQLDKSFNNNFYCIDVNLIELKQAVNVFKSNKIEYIYANVFIEKLPLSFFDLIIMNASVQYFPDLKKLLDKLLTLLNENGEIHIIDSPFYNKSEIEAARKRTEGYYNSLGFPEMSNHYFHHGYDEISNYNYKLLYNPSSFKTKLLRIFSVKDSPFPWISINK
ncbi:MAG: class I SAM-dependent methyltransferase [Ignavibacteriaceae bacterium]